MSGPTSILIDLVISSSFIALEELDLLGRHQTGDQVGLSLFERKAETLVRVIFLVGLVLEVLISNVSTTICSSDYDVPCGIVREESPSPW